MEFAKIWPLTCHNWVKYWPRTKNNTTNREYSARAICWSFPPSSTTLRLETPRGGGSHQPPPPTPAKVAKHRLRARVNSPVEPWFVLWGPGWFCGAPIRPTGPWFIPRGPGATSGALICLPGHWFVPQGFGWSHGALFCLVGPRFVLRGPDPSCGP